MKVDWREAVICSQEAERDTTGFHARTDGNASEVQDLASKTTREDRPARIAGIGVSVGLRASWPAPSNADTDRVDREGRVPSPRG